MRSEANIKKVSALDEILSKKTLYFDNATACFFVSADSEQIGININCQWNQPLLQKIKIIEGDTVYKPTETQILLYKDTNNEAASPYGIMTFSEPIKTGDSICDGPESLYASLVASREVFEGICDIIFKYKLQFKILVEVKNIQDNLWDIGKNKSLMVTEFSINTKTHKEDEVELPHNGPKKYSEKHENQNTESAQNTIREIAKQKALKYLRKLF